MLSHNNYDNNKYGFIAMNNIIFHTHTHAHTHTHTKKKKKKRWVMDNISNWKWWEAFCVHYAPNLQLVLGEKNN